MSKSPIDIIEENRRWKIQKTINNYDGTNLREHLDDIKRINDYYDNLIIEQRYVDKWKNYSQGGVTMEGTYDLDEQQWFPEDEPETKKVRVWVEGYADIEIPLDMDKEEAESEVYIGDLTEWHKWSEE